MKDTFETAGVRTTAGAPFLAKYVPQHDAAVVERLRKAGAVLLGKTNTPLLASDWQTYNPIFGATNNPWDPARTPGGSSGGSAAAVAAGILPLSMSSDGGGSTRIPAAFCGLVGLKASRGRVPRPLGQSEYLNRTSVDGVVTRSVRDTAAVYDYLVRIPNGGSFI